MSFQWPEMLWLLLALPLLVALYFWLLERKKKFALRYASLDIVKEAMGSGIGVRRHVPPLVFLLGLAVLILAIARPTASSNAVQPRGMSWYNGTCASGTPL